MDYSFVLKFQQKLLLLNLKFTIQFKSQIWNIQQKFLQGRESIKTKIEGDKYVSRREKSIKEFSFLVDNQQ